MEEVRSGGDLSLEPASGRATLGCQEKRLQGHDGSAAVWQDEWTKPGEEGGMSATVLDNWSEWRARTRDFEKQLLPSAGAVVIEDVVASWSRGWMSDEECRAHLHSGPGGTAPVSCAFVWDCSSCVAPQLHESNKRGPKGRRVVHVLPFMEKQIFKALMLRKPNGGGWSRHGGWNALGSSHRDVASLVASNALIGQQRYRLATTTIPGRDGDITLKIGEGGLMGGSAHGGSVLGGLFNLTIRWQQLVSAEGAEPDRHQLTTAPPPQQQQYPTLGS